MVETDYLSEANEELQEYREQPRSLEEYVELLRENPESASQAAKYMLEAIEQEGTRTVVEEGEEVERYKFFDDPHNDGEHAILGNTKVLNEFVEDIRSIASGRGKQEKMILVAGPTATGKSELKRNLINGLHEYSKTDEGRRYMLEWNGGAGEDEEWYESPVQEEPLKLLPQETRQELLDDLNEVSEDNIDIVVEGDMDPFSRKHYRLLEDKYLDGEEEDLFRNITGRENVRIKRFLMDKGRGIGVLRSEDEGDAKEKLVGEWMPGRVADLESLGEKDPRAHSYDGIAAQGNRGLAIIEEGSHHRELIEKMLNVTEENSAKLDKDIEMDLDTVFLLISNPDLQAEMREDEDKGELDPLKPLRRRLEKHEFKYLTNYSLENDLIRKMLTGQENIWDEDIEYDDILEQIREPLEIEVRDNREEVHEKEFAPHAIEAAALYDVVTRISDDIYLMEDENGLDEGNDSFTIVDKALLYDRGKLEREGYVLERDDFYVGNGEEANDGIPVTYTKDVLADLLYKDLGRHHEELDVDDVILPQDVLEWMANEMEDAEVFSDEDIDEEDGFPALRGEVEEYILDLQEQDVLGAIMRDKQVTEEEAERYVQHVVAELSERKVDVDVDEPDEAFMKSFETNTIGKFDEEHYTRDKGRSKVKQFRREEILEEISEQYLIKAKDEDDPEIEVMEIPVLNSLLGSHSWEDVERFYDNFDPAQWEEPLAGTDTADIKEEALENMQELFGYSEASAELTSRRVMERAEVALDEE